MLTPKKNKGQTTNDQINYTRLKLLYVDEINELGQEFVEKVIENSNE